MRWLALIVLALALVAAGCGGSDDESSAADETTIEETTTTDETTSEDTTTDDGTDTSGSFDFADENCQALVQAYVGLSAAIAAASGGQDVSGDIEKFTEYVEKVPDEIRADVETIAAAYGTFVDELESLGFAPGEVPDAGQLQALQEASASISTPDVAAAGERLSAWTTENCS